MTQIKKARLDTCLQEKGEGQVQHTPDYHGSHLKEKDKMKSNSPKNAMVLTCMQRGGSSGATLLALYL